MTTQLIVPLPGNERLAAQLASAINVDIGGIEVRNFPDGESYVRLHTPVVGRAVVLVCTLDRPDGKLLPLLFAASTARELRARSVGLVAPYLAYMRQDQSFHTGEAVTSAQFARVLSENFDWLITVDPHLHRRKALNEIYSVPANALHSAPLLSDWIARQVSSPLLIGPDAESLQWVSAVASGAGAPHIVLQKVRRGDRDVGISIPDVERWRQHTPVLVDDIVSTARTMIETIRVLKAAAMPAPVCVLVHGVFAGDAYQELLSAGARQVVSTNTIPHVSNSIDVTSILAEAIRSEAGSR